MIESRAELGLKILSKQEHRVLTLISQNQSSTQIGKQLHVAPTTVKAYLRRIYDKLGVRGQPAAVAEAMRRGEIT